MSTLSNGLGDLATDKLDMGKFRSSSPLLNRRNSYTTSSSGRPFSSAISSRFTDIEDLSGGNLMNSTNTNGISRHFSTKTSKFSQDFADFSNTSSTTTNTRRFARGASEIPTGGLEERRISSRFLRSGSVMNNDLDSSRRISSNIREFMARTDTLFDRAQNHNLINGNAGINGTSSVEESNFVRSERSQSLMPSQVATSKFAGAKPSINSDCSLRRSSRASSLCVEPKMKNRFSVEERIRNLDDECNAILSNGQRRRHNLDHDNDNTLDDISLDELDESTLGSRTLNASTSTLTNRCSDAELRRKLREANRHIDVLKQRLEQQHEEGTEHLVLFKRQFEKKVRELTERLEQARQSALHFERETQRLQSESMNSKKSLDKSEMNVIETESKLRRAQSELEDSNEMRERHENCIKKLKKELKEAKASNKKLKSELDQVQKESRKSDKTSNSDLEEDEEKDKEEEARENKRLRAKLEEQEAKTKEEHLEKESLSKRVHQLESSRLELERKLELALKQHTSDTRSREEMIEAVREAAERRVDALEHQLEGEHQERLRAAKERREMQRRIVNMSNNKDDNVSNLRAMLVDAVVEGDRHQQHGTIVQHLKTMLEESDQARLAALRGRQRLQLELVALQHSLDASMQTEAELRTQIRRLQSQNESIEKLLEAKEETIKITLERQEKGLREIERLNDKIDEQNIKSEADQLEIARLKEQLELVQTKLARVNDASCSRLKQLKMEVEHCDSSKTCLEQRLQKSKDSNEELIEECENLRLRRQELETLLHKYRDELHNLKDENVVLVQREEESSAALARLEQELQLAEIEGSVAKNELNAANRRARALATIKGHSGRSHSIDDELAELPIDNGDSSSNKRRDA